MDDGDLIDRAKRCRRKRRLRLRWASAGHRAPSYRSAGAGRALGAAAQPWHAASLRFACAPAGRFSALPDAMADSVVRSNTSRVLAGTANVCRRTWRKRFRHQAGDGAFYPGERLRYAGDDRLILEDELVRTGLAEAVAGCRPVAAFGLSLFPEKACIAVTSGRMRWATPARSFLTPIKPSFSAVQHGHPVFLRPTYQLQRRRAGEVVVPATAYSWSTAKSRILSICRACHLLTAGNRYHRAIV